MAQTPDLSAAYSDDSVLFRVLRHMGWDGLLNIGYYTLPGLLAAPAGPAPFQRRLARRSLALLETRPGHRVLDAACGRGGTTALLARAGCHALGVDVTPGQIARARERYGHLPRARFAVADVTALPAEAAGVALADGSMDRVHCLEAALHFGHEGRRAFLREAHRVLRPGGRLVLVDVTCDDGGAAGEGLDAHDPGGLVRAAWRFETLESAAGYAAAAADAGFAVHRTVDWTRPVLHRATQVCAVFAALAGTRAGRRALCLRWPGLRTLTAAEWDEVVRTVRAHAVFGRAAGYTACVFAKPADAG